MTILSELVSQYSKRPLWARKGYGGRVLVVGGSRKYSGSPIFNAMAALRAGADLVTLAGHPRAMDAAASYAPDLITVPLNSELLPHHLGEIRDLEGQADALVIGGGLMRQEETYRAIREIITASDLPMVIDAEAIRAVAEQPEILNGKKAVVTPHDEEFRVLTGELPEPELTGRERKVSFYAAQIGAVILLKGHIDIVSNGAQTELNNSGTPLMTKGGLGDVLSGILAAFLARGMAPWQAALGAAYVNGRAGELAAEHYNEGMIAGDVLNYIPEVFKEWQGEGR